MTKIETDNKDYKGTYMPAKLNSYSDHIRWESIKTYNTELNEQVKIEYEISYFSIKETGFVAKGAKKKCKDLGEVISSIKITDENDPDNTFSTIDLNEHLCSNPLEVMCDSLYHVPDIDRMRSYLDTLISNCETNNLSVESAVEYLIDELHQRGFNESSD
jgi:hypothetical protein|tara:strand:+ start:125 stop:604 length:480 start_codon:yes stop_codon:yes gene_type:complete